ncbi:unannotated protein [freshwater metagenome]|uniref:Unannotated protein n=1 Tax=freshwater metagenome TaxID=449393 RepID=A0A6J6G0Z8_9ZZZZ
MRRAYESLADQNNISAGLAIGDDVGNISDSRLSHGNHSIVE